MEREVNPKLIGYGLFSLVFRPPFPLPDNPLLSDLAKSIQAKPDRFVGLITTRKHYHKKIKPATDQLKQLCAKHPDLSRFMILPHSLSAHEDFVPLGSEMVRQLIEAYHAVRKRIEYENTWDPHELIQMIYPYAGTPLAQTCKNPHSALSWEKFFEGMVNMARFLARLHGEDYVHGDLSPNNFLYEEAADGGEVFTIIDWNMLSSSENFLGQRKGRSRVGCWSPEHFSLASARLKAVTQDQHWTIYAEEIEKYTERLLSFCFASGDEREKAVREYMASRMEDDLILLAMYEDLKMTARLHPSLIGKYHDIRYFMDTIAKCVASRFPERTKSQQKQYNLFVSLCLVQNLPGRQPYLKEPDRMVNRLIAILQCCRNPEEANFPDHPAALEAEESVLNLLM